MAVRFYDEALVKKIQGRINDPNLQVLKPQETARMFQVKADMENDKPVKLPFIALSRESSIQINKQTKTQLSSNGLVVDSNGTTSANLNAIPITIKYQLDIYTRHFDEADDYLRNFIFNFINYPKLTVEIPYNGAKRTHNATIILDATVNDNSDIEQRLVSGEFTRWTLNLTIPDAYLFSVPIKKCVKFADTELHTHDKESEVIDKIATK